MLPDEDKICGLIVQAEDIQKHAVALQRVAQDALKTLPEASRNAIKGVAREIITEATENASTALLGASNEAKAAAVALRYTGFLHGFFLVAVVLLVALACIVGLKWKIGRLVDESTELEKEIAVLQARASEFTQKAGKAVLTTCGEKKRTCVRVDKNAGDFFDTKDNNIHYMIIYGY
jgi:hypothetical protein